MYAVRRRVNRTFAKRVYVCVERQRGIGFETSVFQERIRFPFSAYDKRFDIRRHHVIRRRRQDVDFSSDVSSS